MGALYRLGATHLKELGKHGRLALGTLSMSGPMFDMFHPPHVRTYVIGNGPRFDPEQQKLYEADLEKASKLFHVGHLYANAILKEFYPDLHEKSLLLQRYLKALGVKQDECCRNSPFITFAITINGWPFMHIDNDEECSFAMSFDVMGVADGQEFCFPEFNTGVWIGDGDIWVFNSTVVHGAAETNPRVPRERVSRLRSTCRRPS